MDIYIINYTRDENGWRTGWNIEVLPVVEKFDEKHGVMDYLLEDGRNFWKVYEDLDSDQVHFCYKDARLEAETNILETQAAYAWDNDPDIFWVDDKTLSYYGNLFIWKGTGYEKVV